MKEDFLRSLEAILAVATDTLNGEEPLSEFKDWDSMAILELQVYVDNTFSKGLDIEALAKAQTVNDVWTIISQ
ncbi:hypothetical protein [Halodesulfovibrio spirochaetisodalis]|uniref:Carrier domain-containing protein n=1 Tax=Halodesulfovibrio spirochaetisodalis TaxID=1560234 RepID=A0A1B7XAI8_9BACT|nr:hypothetical protein [Halodesulfovibrio spirochaetisodalis]OBQ46393.1 hypothetical protein SP90_12750 [Halodesulfovibrio spirochaetisodalis]